MLEIKNIDLTNIRSFLYDLKLKPKLSRHRTKFVKLLDDKIKDYNDSGVALLQEFAKKDGQGNPIIDNNMIAFESEDKKKEYQKEELILINEKVKINLEEYPNIYDSVKQILAELDEELDKDKADTYEVLCELFNVE